VKETTLADVYDRSPLVRLTVEQRWLAVRAVASMAVDAPDCALLLEALGLNPTEGKP
jgi:hypothetical protein